jgi:hypothetical protein
MLVTRLSDIRFRAVIIGAVADNAGTLFLMNLLAAALVSTGLSEDEVMSRMQSASGLLLGLIIGLGCTVLGGYVAGRMAGKDERMHGALVAMIGMVIALIFREGGVPAWFDIAGFAAMLPAGIAGGHLAAVRRRERESGGGALG